MARRVNSRAIIALSTTFTSYFAFHKGTFDNSKSYTIQLKCSIVYVILSAFSHLISKGITKKIKQNDGDVKKDIYFCNKTTLFDVDKHKTINNHPINNIKT